jgi:CRISPR/Cas system CSM-associated protein Csm4 (group 5 of RAMP superfamily)
MEMAAPKFIPEHDNIRQFSPNGFYELDLWEGVKDDRYKGMAIKLFGWQFFNTPNKLIDKVIHTTRNRKDAIASYNKIRPYLPHCEHTTELLHDSNDRYIKEKLKEVDYLEVEFEAIKENPSAFVDALIVYLGIDPTDEQITKAKQNIGCH